MPCDCTPCVSIVPPVRFIETRAGGQDAIVYNNAVLLPLHEHYRLRPDLTVTALPAYPQFATGQEPELAALAADIFRGRIIDVTESSYVIELTGNTAKLDAFLDAIDRSLILETVRTGVCGIGRGDRILRV